MIDYKFYIDGVLSSAGYSDKMEIITERENENIFFRRKLSDPIDFTGKDFAYIMSQPIGHRFLVVLKYRKSHESGYVDYFTGFFYKTDCKFNLDDKRVTATIKTLDQYTNILDGLEREQDLIKLGVERTPLKMDKRPVVQIYIPGDDVITSVLSGSYWEQSANSTIDIDALHNDFKFSLSNLPREVLITGISGAPSDVNGLYIGETIYTNSMGDLRYIGDLKKIDNPNYTLRITQVFFGGGYPSNLSVIGVEMFNGTTSIYDYVNNTPGEYEDFSFEMNNNSVALHPGKLSAEMKTYRIYNRYLMDVDSYNGNSTWDIPEDDIAGEHYNYKKVYNYGVNNTGRISNRLSDDPTKWGMNPDGKYYLPPSDDPNYFPIARSRWGYTSIWFLNSALAQIVEPPGRKQYQMNDTYFLSAVIDVLAKVIDSDYTHSGTIAFSQFLYGINPLTGTNYRTFITPKSNALLGEYDRPAEKAPITLKQVFDMLRDTCKLYWFVDQNKNIRIEHISYFKKGGSYDSTPVIQLDLTTLKIYPTDRTASSLLNKYTYRKDRMPERVEFGWVDDVSTGFVGVPIVIASPFVDKAKIDKVQIGLFNPDIDFMLLNPEGSGKDGFALLSGVLVSGEYVVPYLSIGVEGVNLTLQNGYWSFPYIQENYYGYDLPPGSVEINGVMHASTPFPMLMRLQEDVSFTRFDDVSTVGLIKTGLGAGEIEKMSLNLHSRSYNITLHHNDG